VDMPPPDAPVASHGGLEHLLSRINAAMREVLLL
jgi:hypothetical protein